MHGVRDDGLLVTGGREDIRCALCELLNRWVFRRVYMSYSTSLKRGMTNNTEQ